MMGEAKRRQDSRRSGRDLDAPLLPGLPISNRQSEQFIAITSKGAWIGIGLLVAFWVTVRFIGPAFGWWQLADG